MKNAHEEQIEDYMRYIKLISEKLYSFFKLECEIILNFVRKIEGNSYIASDALAMVVKEKKRYQIYLKHDDISNLYNENKNGIIFGALFHEFLHIFDREQLCKNKYYSFDFSKRFKTIENYLIFLGFEFWTEYFAYDKMYNKFKFIFKSPTFYHLVKLYKKLETDSLDIRNHFCKSQEIKDKLYKFEKRVEFFIYELSMYMAYENQKYIRKYSYSKRVMNLSESKKLNKIILKIKSYLNKMNHGTYGKYLPIRLFNLGDCILKNIYNPLHLEIIEHRRKFCMAFHK